MPNGNIILFVSGESRFSNVQLGCLWVSNHIYKLVNETDPKIKVLMEMHLTINYNKLE